jgi:hypothetical protein
LLVSNLLLREKNKAENPQGEEKILLEIEKLTEVSYQVPAQIMLCY